jgi:hypothetical protein
MTTIRDDISLFFTDPSVEPEPLGKFSVLYLLRRDIKQCITSGQILWPATMAILAGADLLGKFYAGKDDYRFASHRFREFVGRYFLPITPEDAETIYQLRNALLHSFGLYSKTRNGTVYYFTLIPDRVERLVIRPQRSPDEYLISIPGLHDRFESAVRGYHEELLADADLQKNFSRMFPFYGAVGIGAVVIGPEYP